MILERNKTSVKNDTSFYVDIAANIAKGVSYITTYNAKTGKQMSKRPVDTSIEQVFEISKAGKVVMVILEEK